MHTGFTEINTDRISPPAVGTDLFTNRSAVASMQKTSEVSIIVQAYNRLEKTKRCVESVLTYTHGIDYELILIDNGSEDGTLDYYQSVDYGKKKIIYFTKNVGVSYPASVLNLSELGHFICFLSNDIIVTFDWLKNLLICMKSDPKIGMVNPVSCNTSNLQCVDLEYKSYTEMQQKARQWNRSDPGKWEDRQRLITLGTLYRKEALLAIGWPIGDVGFFHDFGDDDDTFRIRRMGYRTVLAGDTWICHDHDISHGEGKDPVEFQRSLDIGRRNFREKYFGIDAWEDVNNYFIPYLPVLPKPQAAKKTYILGVDVKCGTPILDIKNWLRRAGILDAGLSAFTQDPKYWIDLKTICSGPVICDREEFLTDSFPPETFDYVVADRPLNRYHEPQKMLNDLFSLCKKGGIVICRLNNAFSFQSYLYQLGQWNVYDPEFSYHIPLEALCGALEKLGSVKKIIPIPFGLSEEQRQSLDALLPAELESGHRIEVCTRMISKEYLLIIEKKA